MNRYSKKRKLKLTTFGKVFFLLVGIILLVFVFMFAKCISSADAKPAVKNDGEIINSQSSVSKTNEDEVSNYIADYAVRTDETQTFEMDSENGILIELDRNVIIAEKNADKIIYPASLTKVMTLIVAVENIDDLNDTFTFTTEILDPLYIDEASVAGFLNEETVPIKDLLYGAILPSGADATTALALHIAGSEENFVKMMNKKAESLGLKDTHFMNCSGLHHDNHYSTVHEIALIMKYAMQNDTCRKVLSTLEYVTTKTPQNPEGIKLYSNTFERMYGTEAVGVTILAGKTGYTNESGNCLVSYAESDEDKSYILVTTGASGSYKPIYDAIDIYAEFAGTGETDIQPEIVADSTVIY